MYDAMRWAGGGLKGISKNKFGNGFPLRNMEQANILFPIHGSINGRGTFIIQSTYIFSCESGGLLANHGYFSIVQWRL